MNGFTASTLIAHPLAWVIIALALSSYAQLWRRILQATLTQAPVNKASKVPAIIITALPLVGLLGTIMGMQQSFSALVYASSSAISVTSGIRDALATTLLGISLALPGWLLICLARSGENKQRMLQLCAAQLPTTDATS